jgi:hypothetical protein
MLIKHHFVHYEKPEPTIDLSALNSTIGKEDITDFMGQKPVRTLRDKSKLQICEK